MAKRVAEKELTDRNWDEEEQTEEVGTFLVASEEVLKNRSIKRAKRRNVGFESESGGTFKGFKGFVLPSGAGGFSGFGNDTGTKPLGGLSNGSSSITSNSSGTNLKTASSTQTIFSSVVSCDSVNNTAAEKKPASVEANGESQQPLSSGFTQSKTCSSDVYHKQLAALNCSVRDWIVKHVNANPLCDLTPIFRDYEKYLAEIEQHGISSDSSSGNDSNKATGTQSGSAFGNSHLQQSSGFLFNNNKSEDMAGKKTELEKKTAPTLGSSSAVSFTFSKSVDNSSLNSGPVSSFSFSSGSTGLFGKDANQSKILPSFSGSAINTQAESGGNEDKGDEEDEEEPPKVVVNEVKEEGAFYSKKDTSTPESGWCIWGLLLNTLGLYECADCPTKCLNLKRAMGVISFMATLYAGWKLLKNACQSKPSEQVFHISASHVEINCSHDALHGNANMGAK